MVAYNQYLEVLVDKEQNTKANLKPLFLTIYFPSQGQPKNRLKKEIGSFVSTTLKKSQEGKLIFDQKAILTQVNQTIDNLESLPKGLAFFIKLNSSTGNGKKISPIEEENFVFIPLEKLPQKEIFLGANFDLDQLVWLADKGIDGLVFQINQNEAQIYVYDDQRLFAIAKQKNPLGQQKEAGQYLEQFSPLNFQGIFHGTGQDAIDKKKREKNKLFLKSLQLFVKERADLTESFDYLVINWSSSFAKLDTNFPQELAAFFPKTKVILIDKNIGDPKQLEQIIIKKINQAQMANTKKQLEAAQENFDRYLKSWSKILTAANENRIEKLFIRPVIKKRGYVAKDNQIFTYPVKNSRLVDNIAPWLIHQVLETGGDIIILDQRQKKDFPPIAALLRY